MHRDMTDITYTRLLMLEIRLRLDTPVEITTSIVKSLHFHLQTENYDTIEMIHGNEFMCALIKIHEEYELYEVCAEMLRQSKALSDI